MTEPWECEACHRRFVVTCPLSEPVPYVCSWCRAEEWRRTATRRKPRRPHYDSPESRSWAALRQRVRAWQDEERRRR